MLRTLHRILPADQARRLRTLVAWLAAAAFLHGVGLGLAGVVVAALLDPQRDAAPWLIALAAAVVAYLATQWAAQMNAFRTGSDVARALHLRLGEHVSGLPLGWFTPGRQADLVGTATTGVPQLMSYPAILLRPAITAVITPVAAAATLTVLDWRHALAVVAATAVAWPVSRISQRLASRVDALRHRGSVEATDRILEYATLQPVIRTDQRPDDRDDLDRALDDTAQTARRSAATVLPGLLLFGVTLNAIFAALIGLGVLWVSQATLSVPAFVGLLVVTARLTAVATTGAELAAGLRLQQGVLDRIAGVLDTPPLPVADPAGAAAVERDDELVVAEHVSFRYDERPVLDDVSFVLPRRGLTALVGHSGSGKTTITRLLARFWDPVAGRVLFDGRDLRSYEPGDLYAQLAMVFQDDYLLDATIADNIRAGRPGATDAEVRDAVAAAGLGTTIAGLPDGLDTPVGPAGSRLSGGQRQRVCIARALVKAAPLTLMDEATSALDPENANLVSAAAQRMAASGSVVVIAHNLDTIVHADQILVLDHGHIVQHGTHTELVSRPGPYRALLDARHDRSARPLSAPSG